MKLIRLVGMVGWWLFLYVPAATGQIPPIGIIDSYGLRTISESEVRNVLPFKEGDTLFPDSSAISSLEAGLAAKLKVDRVELGLVCCDDSSKAIVYIGIEETSATRLEFHPPPTGNVILPPEVFETYNDFGRALHEAVLSGDTTDDLLSQNPAIRMSKERFLVYAKQHIETLRHVLRDSENAEYRAAAALVLGYAENKKDVVEDLQQAVLDPSAGVRNNATLVLGEIIVLAEQHPELGIEIRPDVFIDMLNSVVWTDRNTALMFLNSLTRGRQTQVLEQIRQRALLSLVEMSRWKNDGHALAAYVILGRIVGLSDEEMWDTRTKGQREATIAKALRLQSPDN